MRSSTQTLIIILLSGLLIGSLVYQPLAKKNTAEVSENGVVQLPSGQTCVTVDKLENDFLAKLSESSQFATHEGKTWIPVEGNPFELLILTDSSCGTSCDSSQAVATLKQVFTPAMIVRSIEVSSEEGQALAEDFEINKLPAYILGDGFTDFTKDGLRAADNVQIKAVLTEKENKFLVDSAKVGFRTGKFVSPPTFDLAGEPKQGSGPVTVVEFTDYQCPFCKRLHDQNKDLIKKLINENKITYILRDFPLNFHKDAMLIHRAANCALEVRNDEAYWKFHDKIFDDQKVWSGKGDSANTQWANTIASELNIDESAFSTCLADTSNDAEIREDMNEGSSYGVTGTPALFIGTQIMPGAIGPQAFEAAVNAEFNK